jgi:hypothetical protein
METFLILSPIVYVCFPHQFIATAAALTTQKTASLLLSCVYRGYVFTESLPSNRYARHNRSMRLTTLSVSGLHSVDDKITDEHEALDGMRQGKRKEWEKTRPSTILSTTNPT